MTHSLLCAFLNLLLPPPVYCESSIKLPGEKHCGILPVWRRSSECHQKLSNTKVGSLSRCCTQGARVGFQCNLNELVHGKGNQHVGYLERSSAVGLCICKPRLSVLFTFNYTWMFSPRSVSGLTKPQINSMQTQKQLSFA